MSTKLNQRDLRTFVFKAELSNGNEFEIGVKAYNLPQAWCLFDEQCKGKYTISKTYLGDPRREN